MNEDLNRIIDGALPGSEITLPSGEFEGPVTVAKPLRIIGKSTTIWAKSGAVIEVKSAGVSLENIRAELTESSESDCAVKADFPTGVKNVEVLGSVSGFGIEDGFFDVPRTINLGNFAAESENTFTLSVNVPERTEILCDMREAEFSPKTLSAGRNTIKITVRGISEKTLLYAEVLFRTRFTRRIYLLGKPTAGIPAIHDKCIYTAPERNTVSQNAARKNTPESDVVSIIGKVDGSLAPLELRKGQRLVISGYLGARFDIFFTCRMPRGTEIDPYVFLLDERETAQSDRDLVFFGNESSPNAEVRYFPSDGHIGIDLSRVGFSVRKIALAYSIYDGNAQNNFSRVQNARISLRTDSERLSYVMSGLTSETTAVALEFYLYKGEWKLSVIGSGYIDGMARLCNSYGLLVEE